MNFEDLKMDKKDFKKLSKGKAYDKVYDPLFDMFVDATDKLEKSEALIQSAEEDVEIAKENASVSVELANEATARADEATARAESAENKLNESRELQNEAKTMIGIIDTEIGFKESIRETAITKCSEADEEFIRAIGENLTLTHQNSAINKAIVNCTDEGFARDFEGFKQSRINENNRQKGLNKKSANKMRDISTENRLIAEGCTRRINFLQEQRNRALIAYAEAQLNIDLGE